MTRILWALFLLTASPWAMPGQGREWTDSTGKYQVEADMIAFNATTVILKKDDHSLLSVPIEELSAADQEYLKSKEAAEMFRKAADAMQTWTMNGGFKVIGCVVDYGRKEVTIQERRGKIYVNDRVLENLPAVYREMVPRLVAWFEKTTIDGVQGLEAWLNGQPGAPHTYTCEGVQLELENGDEYLVPFFFFSDADLRVLRPGWERWVAAQNDRAMQEQQGFLLRSQAQAYHQDPQAQQQAAALQLQLQAYDAGLFDLWEVYLTPPPGVRGYPVAEVVPARDSRQAAQEAMRRHPGYVVGPINKVRRKD